MINLNLDNKEKLNLTEDEIEITMARKLELMILPILKRNIRFFYAGGDLKGKAEAYKKPTNRDETDEPITSILIPYPNGEEKLIYINQNDEFVEKTNTKEKIYHYNEESDDFEIETISGEER